MSTKGSNYLLKIINLINNVIKTLIGLSLGFMFVILFLEIISRYFLMFQIMWSEEIARYLFIWIVFLGSAYAFKENLHLYIDIFINKIPLPYRNYINIVHYILILIFLILLVYYGIEYSKIFWYDPISTVRFIHLGWIYSIMPLSGVLMILNIVIHLKKMFRKDVTKNRGREK